VLNIICPRTPNIGSAAKFWIAALFSSFWLRSTVFKKLIAMLFVLV
jgi:hypothetical protein